MNLIDITQQFKYDYCDTYCKKHNMFIITNNDIGGARPIVFIRCGIIWPIMGEKLCLNHVVCWEIMLRGKNV